MYPFRKNHINAQFYLKDENWENRIYLLQQSPSTRAVCFNRSQLLTFVLFLKEIRLRLPIKTLKYPYILNRIRVVVSLNEVYDNKFLLTGLMPLITYLFTLMFSLNPYESIALLIQASCPGGSLSNVAAYWFLGDMDLR